MTERDVERVLVAGAGIGGLAAALFLHSRQVPVEVYESAAEVHELGVGINLQPHAVRELEKIGLLDAVAAAGTPCLRWTLLNRFGQEIWTEPRGLAAGDKWPQISIHRGRLQGILLAEVLERLGTTAVNTDRKLVGFRTEPDAVTATFSSRASGTSSEVRADLLIGADGIHSAVRAQLYPDEGEPSYGGQEMWRGVTRAEPFFDGATMTIAGYDEQKFIAYPITPVDETGTCLINWIAEVRASTKLHREDWTRQGSVEDIIDLYASWQFDWLDVPALITGADAIYEFPMIDRDPLDQWTFGRVTLLGDAAHAMYPIGANGASQAIRDGSTLAESLSALGLAGLDEYEAIRRPATTKIVQSNRLLGPEQVMQIAHERAPNGFARIEDVIAHQELEEISRQYLNITWAAPAK